MTPVKVEVLDEDIKPKADAVQEDTIAEKIPETAPETDDAEGEEAFEDAEDNDDN